MRKTLVNGNAGLSPSVPDPGFRLLHFTSDNVFRCVYQPIS
jgi:hypothetical protein